MRQFSTDSSTFTLFFPTQFDIFTFPPFSYLSNLDKKKFGWFWFFLSRIMLKNIWGHPTPLPLPFVQEGLRNLTKKSVDFSILATFNIRLLLFFGELDQSTKLVRLVKKINDHRRKRQENDNFLTKQSPILNPNFVQGSTVIVIPHNVQL